MTAPDSPVAPDGPRRMAAKYTAVVAVVIALGLVFLLLLHSLAIPLVFAAITAVLVHPLQERLTRRLAFPSRPEQPRIGAILPS